MEAIRDAKLRLVLDSAKAVRGMADVQRAGEGVERQQKKIESAAEQAMRAVSGRGATGAEAATKTIERYGAVELSRPEMRKQRADAAFKDRFEAEQSMMEYDLRKAAEEKAKKERNAAKNMKEKASDGGGTLGGIGRLGAMAAAAAAALAAMGKAASIASKHLDNRRNRDMSADGASKQLIDTLTMGSTKKLREIQEDFTGVTHRIREFGIAMQEAAASFRAMSFIEVSNRSNLSQQVAAENLATVSAGASAPAAARFDQSTYRGATLHREEQARLAGRDEIADAERQAAAARVSANHERRVSDYTANGHESSIQLRQRRGAALEHERLHGNQETFNRAAQELREATEREQEMGRQRVAQLGRVREAATAAANAENNLRERNIASMRTELQLTTDRANRLASDASRLGGMSFLDRSLGSAAARMVQEQGIASVTPEVLTRARAYAPEFIQREQERFGANLPELAEDRRRGILTEGTERLDQMRENVLRQQDQIRQQAVESTTQMRNDIAQILREFTNSFLTAMREEVERANAELRAGRQVTTSSAR